MSGYACKVCDEHGTVLVDEIPNEGGAALEAAQRLADASGATVYVYEPGDTDETSMPVPPARRLQRREVAS